GPVRERQLHDASRVAFACPSPAMSDSMHSATDRNGPGGAGRPWEKAMQASSAAQLCLEPTGNPAEAQLHESGWPIEVAKRRLTDARADRQCPAECRYRDWRRLVDI